MKFINWVKLFLLKIELQHNDFTIGGFNDNMVRILGYRFLKDWEVKKVHEWRAENKIIQSGVWEMTSPVTGINYKESTYRLI